MRALVWAAIAALTAAVLPAQASRPEAPGPDVVTAWLIEWAGGSKPATQKGLVHYADFGSSDRTALFVVGATEQGTQRELHDGLYTHGFWGPGGAGYAAVYADGRGTLTPTCPATQLCSYPAVQRFDGELPVWHDTKTPVALSFYVVGLNIEITKITTSPGWRAPRPVRGANIRLVRNVGTGVRYQTPFSTGSVEHFTGASAAGGEHGSVAMSWIPCPFPPTPAAAPGLVELRGGGPLTVWSRRVATCSPYLPFAAAAGNDGTTWRLVGTSTGWTPVPDRLTIVDLPPAEKAGSTQSS